MRQFAAILICMVGFIPGAHGQDWPHEQIPMQNKHAITLECFQSGKRIIEENNVQEFSISDMNLNARLKDGSKMSIMTFKGSSDIACSAVEKQE